MSKKTKTFRSKLEQSVAEILDQVGAKYEYENQQVADLLGQLKVEYEYETHQVAYTIMHHYNPDFILPNGIYLEALP